jgi:PRC-barrel domain protein
LALGSIRAIQRKGCSRWNSRMLCTVICAGVSSTGDNMEHVDETASLISAGKVQGTPVYNIQGESLGELEDVMIDKRSGKIVYAVMSFGGFLGMGNDYHPLPWNALKYDTRRGGYVVGLTKQQLEGAPHFGRDENPAWGDRTFEQRIHDYYRAPPYWATS